MRHISQFKLLFIISLVLITALLSLLFLSSSFYKSELDNRVTEELLLRSSLIASSFQTSFESFESVAKYIDSDFSSSNELFNISSSIISITITDYDNKTPKTSINPIYESSGMVSLKKIADAVNINFKRILYVTKNRTLITDFSEQLGTPALSLAISTDLQENPDRIVIITFDPRPSFGQLPSNGLINSFLVNSQGAVIAAETTENLEYTKKTGLLDNIDKIFTAVADNRVSLYQDNNSKEYYISHKRIGQHECAAVSIALRDNLLDSASMILYRNILIMLIIIALSVLCSFIFLKGASNPINKGSSKNRKSGKTSSFSTKHDKALLAYFNICSLSSLATLYKTETALALINNCEKRFNNAIRSTNGVKSASLGDVFTVFFKSTKSVKHGCHNAALCALMIRKEIFKFNTKYKLKKPLKMRCGIDNGIFVTGTGDLSYNKTLGIIGDTVKKVSQIEHLNDYYETDILVSEYIYSLLKDKFYFEAVKPIILKGSSQKLLLWALLGLKKDSNAPKNISELQKRIARVSNKSNIENK
ncbi:MAG TPA: adenylate/guanylate cyclase domain-containing protein [Spirochaetota bacterium]|mgnify:CR=1 FL=1|nr:adenylate/guanylate cyclase domain-containing protein [Spirochaetota bacterium]